MIISSPTHILMTSKCITGKVTNALFSLKSDKLQQKSKQEQNNAFLQTQDTEFAVDVTFRKSQRKIEALARPGYNKKIGAETLNLS